MSVARRCTQLGVAEQHFNDAHINVRIQQMRCKTMPQCMQSGGARKTHKVFSRVERPTQLAR